MNYTKQECPYDWRKAWQHPWQIACGGNEIPCKVNGKWYLFVLNVDEKKYYYYCFEEDIFKTEKEFEEIQSPWLYLLNKEKEQFNK